MKTLPAKAKISGLTLIKLLLIVLVVLAVARQTEAQSSQFFRISGPAATSITAFNPDGTLVWSNAMAGTNYTVQTVTSLPGGTNWVGYVQLPITNGVNTNQIVDFNPPAGMAFIPAGIFTIGSTLDSVFAAIPTNVFTSAFYIDKNPIYCSQWQVIYTYATNLGYTFVHAGVGKDTNHPVVSVDWYDCIKWCNARSQFTGLKPVYYTDSGFTQPYTNGETTNIFANWTAGGYRLPTEAEWEKSSRGGLSGKRFPWGDTISWNQANYLGDSSGLSLPYDLATATGFDPSFATGGYPYTSPVGYFAANGYGLYDMAGNVYEWCWDWYAGTPYPTGSPYLGGIDPHGPVTGIYRFMRGGGWGNTADQARCAYRYGQNTPDYPIQTLGFRCVRGL